MKSDFKMLCALVSRNNKIYFKDKLNFFLSLLSPLILIVLYILFLKNVYVESLKGVMQGVELSNRVINGFAGSWLFSSIMGVSTVTIAFCSNMIMVTDKINKNVLDFNITPVKKHIVNLSYLISNFISTFLVCLIAMVVGYIYIACVGWYLSFLDMLLILITIVLSTLFGCLLSNIVCSFIKNQGGISAVSTLVSSMYGFLCGAYMPLSQTGVAIRNFVSFLPGTYGSLLFRNFYLRGVVKEVSKGIPTEAQGAITELEKGFDLKFSFFNNNVPHYVMFIVLILSCVLLLVLYLVVITKISNKKIHHNIKPKKVKG